MVGILQFLPPQVAGQFYWAGRVAQLGIGTDHDGSVPTVESLAAALEVALSPTTTDRAAAVAGLIRTDGAELAAKLISRAAEHRMPRPRTLRMQG